jgi:hypothetical protein
MVDFWTDTTLDLWAVTRALNPWKNQLSVLRERHEFYMTNKWLQDDKVIFDGGKRIEKLVKISDTGVAEFTNPMAETSYDLANVMDTIIAPWRLAHVYHAVTDDEVEENRPSALQLQNLLNVRRLTAADDMANLLESWTFKAPSGATTSQKDFPYGVPYSVVPITGAQVTAATYGHQGANNTNYSDCYNLDTSTTAKALFRNYNDVWTNASGEITDDDVVKITRMLRRLKFRGPITAKQYESKMAESLALYTSEVLLESAEKKARANNDNLGADLGKYAGSVVTKGIPWQWAEELDDTARFTYPLIALDHNAFVTFVQKGEFYRELKPKRLERQPRVIVTDVYLKFNWININRRRCGRIDYVAAA